MVVNSPFFLLENPQIRWLKDNFFLLWYQLGYFLLTPNFCCWTPNRDSWSPGRFPGKTCDCHRGRGHCDARELVTFEAAQLWWMGGGVGIPNPHPGRFVALFFQTWEDLGMFYMTMDYMDQLYSMITTHVQPLSRRLGDSLFKALPFWPGHLDHVDESLDHKGRLHGSPNIMGIQPFQTWPRMDGDSAHSGSGGLGRNHMIFKKAP